MKKIIIAFNSRNNLYSFVNLLKSNGIPATIINTPSAIGSSCGLSAKTDYNYYNVVISLYNRSGIGGLRGIYLENKLSNQNSYTKLY